MPFPSGDYAGLDLEINGFLDKLRPVFAEIRTLQKFSMRSPSTSSHWEIYPRLIHSLPQTLRHFEIYLTRDILFFDCEEFKNAMARFPELKSVSLIMMQWLAEFPGETEEYAEILYAELPELAARVHLEVVWQGHGCKFGPASDRDVRCSSLNEVLISLIPYITRCPASSSTSPMTQIVQSACLTPVLSETIFPSRPCNATLRQYTTSLNETREGPPS